MAREPVVLGPLGLRRLAIGRRLLAHHARDAAPRLAQHGFGLLDLRCLAGQHDLARGDHHVTDEVAQLDGARVALLGDGPPGNRCVRDLLVGRPALVGELAPTRCLAFSLVSGGDRTARCRFGAARSRSRAKVKRRV